MSETAEKVIIDGMKVLQKSCCSVRMKQRKGYVEITSGSGLKGADIILVEDEKLGEFITKMQIIKNQQTKK